MLARLPRSIDLSTDYLGLRLRSPFIVGASPFYDDAVVARKVQDQGAGAIVMRSLFTEQLPEPPANAAAGEAEAPPVDAIGYQTSPEQYLRRLKQLKQSVTIPVIASLNGHRPGAWTEFAQRLEAAGADAIELNFYRVVTDPTMATDQIETEMLEAVGMVVGSVRIPVAVKLSPYHTSVAQLGIALELEGAAGLVLFNRFYQPDVDTDTLAVRPVLHLSDPAELLLRLRWLAILSPLLRGSLAASGGVHSADDAVKAMLTGAHAVQVVSVLLKHGPKMLSVLRTGLTTWMRHHDYTKLDQFRGQLNLARCPDPAALERANYIRVLQSWPA
jgi:dihydroorotate dehydrogenase (fumarate)